MQDAINTVVKNLTKILKSEVIDWNIFDEELRKIEDINIMMKNMKKQFLPNFFMKIAFIKTEHCCQR